MIVVKVELWPLGHEARAVELTRVYIANDGTGDRKTGNYNVAAMRKGERRAPWKHGDGLGEVAKPTRTGRVESYAKSAYTVLRLVARSLRSMYPEWGEWDTPPDANNEEFHGKQFRFKEKT